jgi:hypothetical protein
MTSRYGGPLLRGSLTSFRYLFRAGSSETEHGHLGAVVLIVIIGLVLSSADGDCI